VEVTTFEVSGLAATTDDPDGIGLAWDTDEAPTATTSTAAEALPRTSGSS
jgi:hypothetical protein